MIVESYESNPAFKQSDRRVVQYVHLYTSNLLLQSENANDNDNPQQQQPNNNNNNNRARRSGKKARRRDLEQRRELRRQREAALAMGFDGNDEAQAMEHLLQQQMDDNEQR